MDLNLDIDNYNENELKQLFDLPINYDKIVIETQSSILIENINKNTNIDEKTKKLTIIFLKKAKNIIIKGIQENKIIESNNNIIQEKKEIPYILSFPYEYFQGTINPLKKRTIIQYLNIDSRFRNNRFISVPSDFNITLPSAIKNVLQYQLVSIELPSVFYNISEQYKNNRFKIIINDEEKTILIPFGDYNNTTIFNAINVNLNNMGTPFSFISFSLESYSSKTIIQPNGSGIVDSLDIIFYENDEIDDICEPIINQQTLGWLLGFRRYKYSNRTNYISECPIDLSGIKYYYLAIDDFHNNMNKSFYGAFKSSLLNNYVIARISNKPNKNRMNVLFDGEFGIVSTPREYFGPIDILSMNVQLLDEYGYIIDTNNMNINFTLSLISVYDI